MINFLRDRLKASSEGAAVYREKLQLLDASIPNSISVVGNAASLLTKHDGTEIDSRATIRFNSAPVVDTRAQGSRWDILATSSKQTLQHYMTHEPKYGTLLFTPYLNRHLRDLRRIGSRVPMLLYPMRMSNKLSWQCLARPTCGMQILYLLAELGRRDVHIYGFDWKATPTFYDQRTTDPHNHLRERRLARRLINAHGWVIH